MVDESQSTVSPGSYRAGVTYLKLSPSKAGTWVDCPRRYFHTYVERRRVGISWAHFSLGNSIHAALRAWFELPRNERTLDVVEELVGRVWIDAGFRDREQSEQWRRRATRLVAAYLGGVSPDSEPIGVERTLAFKTDGVIIEGRIDRIDRIDDHDGRPTVVDYKTGKSMPSTDDVRGSHALAMYALMVQRALGEPCFEVSLHHLPSGTQSSWTHTSGSLERHLNRMLHIAGDIVAAQDTWESASSSDIDHPLLDELFPARPSAVCGYCDHWDICTRGRESTERKDSWAGLPAEGH